MTGDIRRANLRTLRKLLFAAVAMFGFGFALVPLYSVFCDVTGLNRDAVQALANNTQVDYSRRVIVELVANTQDDRIWRFSAPSQPLLVHPGQLVQVEYTLENLTDQPLLGRAVHSFGPLAAGPHFKNIECFCFRNEHLAPREKTELPLVFVIDRNLPKDINVVTLSYTLFRLAPGTGT
ncbi:MAG TPA: cytochrome c oxidase assembly protein [Parasulfuritortus sp.]